LVVNELIYNIYIERTIERVLCIARYREKVMMETIKIIILGI